MSEFLKLLCLNMEGNKHIKRQLAFFEEEKPDILCLQEVFERDFIFIKNQFDMHGHFAPMFLYQYNDDQSAPGLSPIGIGLLTKFPMENTREAYYVGERRTLHEFIPRVTPQRMVNKVLITGCYNPPNGKHITIGTTHFTWSEGGISNSEQRRDLGNLMSALAAFDEIVFCGDFNAPRGRCIFDSIAMTYTDHIPENCKSTIDGSCHYGGNLDLVVDGLFSTSQHSVTNVRLKGGVSDHYAIIANIA